MESEGDMALVLEEIKARAHTYCQGDAHGRGDKDPASWPSLRASHVPGRWRALYTHFRIRPSGQSHGLGSPYFWVTDQETS